MRLNLIAMLLLIPVAWAHGKTQAFGGDPDPRIILYRRTPEQIEKDRVRKAEIAQCASCHQYQYEQWKKGPHSHAFENVAKAIREQMGNPEHLSSRKKKKRIKEFYNSACVSCHSGNKILYEDSLDAQWDGKSRVKKDEYEFRSWLALTHGVDCIVCHVREDRVVTRMDYVLPKDFVAPEGFCNPLPSKTFSHINNCITCHMSIVEDYEGKFSLDESERVAPYLKCETCHMQDGPNGRSSHYYYWGTGEAKKKYLQKAIFDSISVSVREEGGVEQLSFYWEGDFAPHAFIPYTPKLYIMRVQLLGSNQQPFFQQEIRFYDKSKEDDRSEKEVRVTNPTGELVELQRTPPFRRLYDLPQNAERMGTVRLIILRKSDFEKQEEAAVEVYRREEPYKI